MIRNKRADREETEDLNETETKLCKWTNRVESKLLSVLPDSDPITACKTAIVQRLVLVHCLHYHSHTHTHTVDKANMSNMRLKLYQPGGVSIKSSCNSLLMCTVDFIGGV